SGSDTATDPLWTSPWFPRRLLPTCLAQLAIDTNRSQVGHDVVRFTSIWDWRAVVLATSGIFTYPRCVVEPWPRHWPRDNR
ncbi:MAG: hypothetical protein QGF59_02395, partial [Pirellulaceae bacterium]|nr:hypothetical protein [Pirellulaceae bacterium]